MIEKEAVKNRKTKKLLSLFSGCGGMDLGFEGDFKVLSESVNFNIHKDWISTEENGWVNLKPTTFQTVFANDVKKSAAFSWIPFFGKKGIPKEVFNLGSVVDCVRSYNNGNYNIFPDEIDIVTGGFPCQDFSIAGKRKGFDSQKSHDGQSLLDSTDASVESRGMLYIWMREVVRITKPKVFVAENVKGLVSLSNVKDIITNDFSNIEGGYLVIPARVLHAAEYGVPQNRERVIFIGFKKSALRSLALKNLSKNSIPDEYDPYPIITHFLEKRKRSQFQDHLLPIVDVKTALKGLMEPEYSKNDLSQQSYSKAKWYGRHCQGQTEINLNKIGPTIRSEHHGNIEFRRLHPDNGGKILHEFNSNLAERRLTVRECARIQTFPDDFEFVRRDKVYNLSASDGYKLVGNAVPPLLAHHIAKRLENLWPLLFKDKA
jgi:DNA (cytosine-5)-methyltransferase 1